MNTIAAPTTPDAASAPIPVGLYQPLDWMLVRSPALPVEAYLALRQGLPCAGGDRADDTIGIVETLERFPAGPQIAAALAVGSPSLFDALERSGLAGEDGERRAAKLLRYLIRMSTRPTPYGLFAGVGIARCGPQTTLRIGRARPKTRTRPDMGWLLPLVFELEGRPDVRAQLSYLANPCALTRAGRVFLPAPAPVADGAGPGPSLSVRATRVVATALDLARTPIPHDRLVTELAALPGATRAKAETLIDELWRQTLLLSDLRPPLTGASPAEYVARRLEAVPGAAEARGSLAGALAAMATWDDRPWEGAAVGYRALSLALRQGPEPGNRGAAGRYGPAARW